MHPLLCRRASKAIRRSRGERPTGAFSRRSSNGSPPSMPLAPTHALKRRHQLVREALDRSSSEALLVTSLSNIAYLTNFGGSTAIVLLTHDRLIFITDSRYVTSIEQTVGTPSECPQLETVLVQGAYDPT